MSLAMRLLFLMFVFIYQKQVESCKCMKQSLQETFCQSDIVMLAKVTSRTSTQHSSLYLASFQATIRRMYRLNTSNKELKKIMKRDVKITIYTPRTLSLCHAIVKKNSKYIIGGSIKRNNVYVTSCSLLKKWNNVPKHIRRSIRKNRLSCRCIITGCHSNKCVRMSGSPPLTNNCEYKATFIKDCYEKNGVCYENNGKCEWTSDSIISVDSCILSSSKFKMKG